MHAEDLWVGLRAGLLDQYANILLLDHLLALVEELQPGGLGWTYVAVRAERISLAELRRRNQLGLLHRRAAREAMNLLLNLLESSRPGCLRLLELELEFTPDPGHTGGVRLERLLVLNSLR